MAVSRDILFAVSKGTGNKVTIGNVSSEFETTEFALEDGEMDALLAQHTWVQYFVCAYKGVKLLLPPDTRVTGLRFMIDGTIPRGAGMSSSSAMVCGFAVALLKFHNVLSKITP